MCAFINIDVDKICVLHFHGDYLKLAGISQPQRDPNSLGHGGFPAARPTEPESVVPHDLGKRKIHQKPSETEIFRPHLRKIGPLRTGKDDAPPQGKKYIPAPRITDRPRAERQKSELFNQQSTTSREFVVHMGTKGRVRDKNGIDVGRARPTAEAQVEKQFGSKIRCEGPEAMRSGLPIANLGDKVYAAVEYSPGFFQSGGLISGANIGTRGPKSTQNVHMTLGARNARKSRGVKCVC